MKNGALPQSAWLVASPYLRGVFVGGCVDRGVGSRFMAKAHAHTHGSHAGWICFLSQKWIHVREIWLHEIAHLGTKTGHTMAWRRFLIQLGGTLDPIIIDGVEIMRSYHQEKRR